jgi:serine/threonine protein kinase
MNAANDPRGLSIPGYTLSRRLGAGGYGEVWLAHAPGGLTKAVKFIFGSYNDKRAEHELRALQKVKEVRHPFLLSLERIEVVDGRLVIVTELADASLKDRFDECVKQGLPGIPRAELLGYMRDAADALDFLSKGHSLQHLDVKPENLLMLAGHVKVADFGLVKDVGKSQASLVGGLTPLYSAPEVFQGAPSTFSDQYSLAVLYQEMLTSICTRSRT